MNYWFILHNSIGLLVLFDIVYTAQNNVFRYRANKFCWLSKKCTVRAEKDYDYKKLTKISDIPGIQPSGYLVKLTFYVLASRDAHIVFSSTESPNWIQDNVYEILIGGWGNERTLIRRKRQDNDMIVEYKSNILRKDDPLQINVEISNEGKIQVFIEYQKEPLAMVEDKNRVLPIKYFGFASYDNSLAKFFYNCKGEIPFQKKYINGLALDKDEPSPVDLRNFLITKCNYYSVKYDSDDYDYKDFIKISDIENAQPDGYILRIVLYIQAARDANILLTTRDHPNFERDFVYEFVIGGWGNELSLLNQSVRSIRTCYLLYMATTLFQFTILWKFILKYGLLEGRMQLRRKKGYNVLADVNESGVINPERPSKLLLEIAYSGSIRLYTEKWGSKPIIAILEENPLPIEYISFSGWKHSEAQFYYNCSHIDTTVKSIMT